MLACTESSEKWSYSGYILKVEQNCRIDGLDMGISEIGDDINASPFNSWKDGVVIYQSEGDGARSR